MKRPDKIDASLQDLNILLLHALTACRIPRFRMHPAQQFQFEGLAFFTDKTQPAVIPETLRILGLSVVVDTTIDKGTIQLEDLEGNVLGKIENLAIPSGWD